MNLFLVRFFVLFQQSLFKKILFRLECCAFCILQNTIDFLKPPNPFPGVLDKARVENTFWQLDCFPLWRTSRSIRRLSHFRMCSRNGSLEAQEADGRITHNVVFPDCNKGLGKSLARLVCLSFELVCVCVYVYVCLCFCLFCWNHSVGTLDAMLPACNISSKARNEQFDRS